MFPNPSSHQDKDTPTARPRSPRSVVPLAPPLSRMFAATSKKRPRVASATRLSADDSSALPPSPPPPPLLYPTPGGFNDPLSADLLLRLLVADDQDAEDLDPPPSDVAIELYLHSHALRRSNYFAALLSDRWRAPSPENPDDPELPRLTLRVASGAVEAYLTVLRLLYASDLSSEIVSPGAAIAILPAALALLFDECVGASVRFLEGVPWTEDEESAVVALAPLLGPEESRELLARVSPPCGDGATEEMLHELIRASVGSAKVKAFAAKMLRDFPSREAVRRVFDRAFAAGLRTVRESLEKYSSPDFRGDNDETEAIQRLNLHTAVCKGKDLLWLVERMIELRVADRAVEEWSEQTGFVADLQRAFQDDAWRNIAPGLPALVMRCTSRLADAVAAGWVLAARQVRLKLVSVWLPVLIVCREKNASSMPCGQKQLYMNLEETFLRIISTLPMSDAETLLHHCLSFATRNVDDCPHLVAAFNTWFRRVTRSPASLGDDIPS